MKSGSSIAARQEDRSMRRVVFVMVLALAATAAAQDATVTIYRPRRSAAAWRRPPVRCYERGAAARHHREVLDVPVQHGNHTLRTEGLPGFAFTAESDGHSFARVELVSGFNANWKVPLIDPQLPAADRSA